VDAQTQRERVLRLAAAGLILALWAAWALLTWQNAIRTVDVDQFHQDLASGEVLTYRLTANTRHDRPWPPSGIGSTDFDTIALDDSGVPEDGQVADGLVYWMGSGVGRERIVPYDAFVTPYLDPPRQAIEAGVRPVVLPPDQAPTPDAGAPYGWAASALMVGALIAQKPRRATRWFWFFFLQAPLGLGAVTYAVSELALRPSGLAMVGDQPRPRRRAWPGLAGFAFAGLATILVGFATEGLRSWLGGVLVP
jgi:hypothetical protein